MITQHTEFSLSPRWYLSAQEAHHILYPLGSADSLVVEWWTHDQKVLGSSPNRRGGITFFSKVNFCAESYFGIQSTTVLVLLQ